MRVVEKLQPLYLCVCVCAFLILLCSDHARTVKGNVKVQRLEHTGSDEGLYTACSLATPALTSDKRTHFPVLTVTVETFRQKEVTFASQTC